VIPAAPLVWRTVLSTPAARPARSGGTPAVAATVSEVNAAAVPNPDTIPATTIGTIDPPRASASATAAVPAVPIATHVTVARRGPSRTHVGTDARRLRPAGSRYR
jgi:hypothetical protein